MRQSGLVTNDVVLIAVGIDWESTQIIAVQMAGRESRSAWKNFLLSLKSRGSCGRVPLQATARPELSQRRLKVIVAD